MIKLSHLLIVVSTLVLAGCWQATSAIYGPNDFHVPVDAPVVSINDAFGPLGIYSIDEQKQYVPLFREAKGMSLEREFRDANIALVPLDRILAFFQKGDVWVRRRDISKQLFPNSEKYLYLAISSRNTASAQALAVAYIEGDVLARCKGAIYDKSPKHSDFLKQLGSPTGAGALLQKVRVASLVFDEIMRAQKSGSLRCDEYRIKTHQTSEVRALSQEMRRGDARRAISGEQQRQQQKIVREREAEENASAAGKVYDPDGSYIVTAKSIVRLKRGSDRKYRPSYNFFIEANNGQFQRPYRLGDLVGRAKFYRDSQQFIYESYTFTPNKRCAEFTDAYWFGALELVEPGIWRISNTYPNERAYDGNACVAYEVRVNSCARVRCSGRLKTTQNAGSSYLVRGKSKATALYKQLK